MKATELRIGNFLEIEGEICRVETIEDSGGVVSCEEDSEWIDWFQFSPIWITEEWLLRLGFKYEDGYGVQRFYTSKKFGKNLEYWIEFKFPVKNKFEQILYLHTDIGAKHLIIPYPIYKNINYVHELQNVFYWLSKEELSIIKENTINDDGAEEM